MNHRPGPKGDTVYDEEISSDELVHWGRKGMKLGCPKGVIQGNPEKDRRNSQCQG